MTPTQRKPKRRAGVIDKHVGERLRLRRQIAGVYQEQLADKLGVTFQQIQKYERGINRISAGRLWEISQILKVPTSYFYEDIKGDTYTIPQYSKEQIHLIRLLPKTPLPMQKAIINVLRAAQR